MKDLRCQGWWEQRGYGRQAMRDLILRFENGQVSGSGWDIIGPFDFHGFVEQEQVRLIKQYIDAHDVEYPGMFDGEGTLRGNWQLGGFQGNWMIQVGGPLDAAASEIQDWP